MSSASSRHGRLSPSPTSGARASSSATSRNDDANSEASRPGRSMPSPSPAGSANAKYSAPLPAPLAKPRRLGSGVRMGAASAPGVSTGGLRGEQRTASSGGDGIAGLDTDSSDSRESSKSQLSMKMPRPVPGCACTLVTRTSDGSPSPRPTVALPCEVGTLASEEEKRRVRRGREEMRGVDGHDDSRG